MDYFRYLLVIFALTLCCLAIQSSPEVTCSEYAHCDTCAKAASWISNCRWCPRDQRCHAFGSLLNPCHADENIKNPKYCPPNRNHTTEYNAQVAYQMLRYSKSAYSTDKEGDPDPSSSPYFPANATYIKGWTFKLVGSGSSFGFLAIDKENEQVVLCFRGSTDYYQIVDEVLHSYGVKYPSFPGFPAPPGVTVVDYFLSAWKGISGDLEASLPQVMKDHPTYRLLITGHSFGGAIASLTAFGLVRRNLVDSKKVSLYTFGQPRTGNIAYANMHSKLIPDAYRVVNNRDPVPHVPICTPKADTTKQECEFTLDSFQPWHAKTEIYYDKGEYEKGIMCTYRECVLPPMGEDHSCSDGLIDFPAEVFLPGLTIVERIKLIVDWAGDLIDQHSEYWDVLEYGFCGIRKP